MASARNAAVIQDHGYFDWSGEQTRPPAAVVSETSYSAWRQLWKAQLGRISKLCDSLPPQPRDLSPISRQVLREKVKVFAAAAIGRFSEEGIVRLFNEDPDTARLFLRFAENIDRSSDDPSAEKPEADRVTIPQERPLFMVATVVSASLSA